MLIRKLGGFVRKWMVILCLFIAGYTFAQDIENNSSLEDSINVEVKILQCPTNLTAKAINDNTISLRWQSAKDEIEGYTLFRKRGDTDFIQVVKLAKDKTYFIDEELVFNVNYSYKVQSYNSDKTSGFSEEVMITTVFPNPTRLKVTPLDEQSVRLNWQDNCDFEAGFIIERKNVEGDYIQIGKTSANTTKYFDEGLTSGEKYYYQIKSETRFNTSLASNEISTETEFFAPSDFQVKVLDDQSTRLTWNNDYNYEKGFIIERKTSDSELEVIAELDTDTRYYVDENLEDSKTYTYVIKAFTDINQSRPSNAVSAELTFPPPQKLVIEVLNDHTAKLHWEDRFSLAEAYILERKVNDEEYKELVKLAKEDRTYLDEELQLGDEYTYRIKARSKVNESEFSNEVGTKTDFPGPENLYAENIDDRSLRLYWEDNCTFETGYRIERKVSGENFEEIATLNANSTSYADTDLKFGTNYNYRVIAFTPASESAYSNIITAKTIFPEPTYLSVLVIDDRSVKLSWTDNCTFDTGFNIERKDGKGDFAIVKQLPATADSFVDTGLKYGTQYIYRVATSTSSNVSNYSSEIIARTIFPAPTYLSSEVLDDKTASLYWEDNCDFETGYRIQRRTDEEEYSTLAEIPANSTSFTDSDITFEKTYYYRVQAITAINGSDFSNVEYLNSTFPPPSDLNSEILSAGKIELTWKDNCFYEDGYKIERSSNGSEFKVIRRLNADVTEYIDKDLDYDTDYSYRVFAFTSKNKSHYTNTISEYYGLLTPGNFIISKIADRQVKLKWVDNISIEDGFKIQRRTENTEFKTIDTIQPNIESYIDSETEIHTKYYYRIYSYLGRNYSPESSHHSATCHFGELRVPQDHASIQAAINFAVSGDMVIVQPGIYKENLSFEGKNITVCSKFFVTKDRSYINSTILDGKAADAVVSFNNEETQDAELIGFTIQNGIGNNNLGGGIFIYNSNPTISDVIIQNNNGEKFGGGMYLYNSNSLIENAVIKNNRSLSDKQGYGGGIYLSNSNPVLKNVDIIDNQANDFGGGLYIYDSNPELTGLLIAGNEVTGSEYAYGGGIYTQYSKSVWSDLTITDNKAEHGGGIYCNSFSNPTIMNSIIWNNIPQEVCFHKFGDIKMTVSYSNIMNMEEGFKTNSNGSIFFKMGVIDSDPKFKDPQTGNYELLKDSPCIDTGDPAEKFNDPDGSRNDMGAK